MSMMLEREPERRWQKQKHDTQTHTPPFLHWCTQSLSAPVVRLPPYTARVTMLWWSWWFWHQDNVTSASEPEFRPAAQFLLFSARSCSSGLLLHSLTPAQFVCASSHIASTSTRTSEVNKARHVLCGLLLPRLWLLHDANPPHH